MIGINVVGPMVSAILVGFFNLICSLLIGIGLLYLGKAIRAALGR